MLDLQNHELARNNCIWLPIPCYLLRAISDISVELVTGQLCISDSGVLDFIGGKGKERCFKLLSKVIF